MGVKKGQRRTLKNNPRNKRSLALGFKRQAEKKIGKAASDVPGSPEFNVGLMIKFGLTGTYDDAFDKSTIEYDLDVTEWVTDWSTGDTRFQKWYEGNWTDDRLWISLGFTG